ncbi:SPFH domain-containing protein [Streptomyces chiangmaiensis]|uniref:SPFH domain-containing protein n=1 Tax=Streptomyces chiangmaiensis TaxID=766497 RepID=A0ABU7FW69_9ACTN|nr:SPFH domain-containing protein [Streptomyces chiangmaiensis]MED7828341.1 SPFH domain-containing protein [Streptomyces chiangmaiensis]
MNTKTSQNPEPEGAPEEVGTPPARLIQSESTTEIPVHLLFREDSDSGAPPVSPAVVGRRLGTGEQPRVRPQAPPRRQPPDVDPQLVERPAWVLPGMLGVLVGLSGAVGCGVVSWWAGFVSPAALRLLELPASDSVGLGRPQVAAYIGAGVLFFLGFGGLMRGQTGGAWVLSVFGRYRGTTRRTGLMWVNPLVLRRRADVRLRHWRSEPMAAVDANGLVLKVVVLVTWRVNDTARAVLGIDDHETYLRECVESALARVLPQVPADLPGTTAVVSLRNVEAVGDALTRLVAGEAEPVGLEVFAVQPTRIEYAPEVAARMQRRRIAALDVEHRDTVLSSLVDSVEDTVIRLTTRGLVELDDYERKALVKDLTVAFYTGRTGDGT